MTLPEAPTLRPATPADVDTIFALVRGLADYERLAHEVTGSAERLREHLFGPRPCAEVVLADVGGQSVGFALFFQTYSTFLTAPGLYLEDLFVEPAHRGRGVGTALLRRVAALAVERGCGRLEWAVLEWNTPAIEFYVQRGARMLSDWRTCRVTDEALVRLGSERSSASR
jgi:GNAT superfamily N-acetyltransferase